MHAVKHLAAGLAASSIVLVAALSSCSGTPTVDMPDGTAPPPDTGPPMACPSGYTQCGADCFALKRDPTNCGMCGHACKDGEVCVQGGCALQCGGNTVKCGGTCVNSKSDPENCGMCGSKCPSGQVCNVGKCATSCQSGLTDCSGACVDLQTDDDNCGMCATSCDVGQHCSSGKCVANCQKGWTSCPDSDGGTTCVDLTTDNSNCGVCGTQCKNGEFCSPGADGGGSTCGLSCFGGTTKCGNKCADLQIDPQNCGACNTPCNGTCFNAHCCSGNQLYCNGACRDTTTDQNNCGGCGIVCGGPCNNGVCCNNGEQICNGKCTNTQFDPQNCGGCNKPCTNDAQPNCSMGSCVSCQNNVLILSDNNQNTNSAFLSKVNNAGLNGTMVNDGVYTYTGSPAASGFGVTMIMVGDDYTNDMAASGQNAIVAAQQAGKGVVITDWGGWHVFNNRWQTLKSIVLYPYTTGTTATLDFKLESMGHPIWTGLPMSWTTTSTMGASTGNIVNGGTRIAGCTACNGAGVVVRSGNGGRIVYVVHAANYQNNTTWVNDSNTVNLTINAIKWATGCLL
jgi:hypothetical protein